MHNTLTVSIAGMPAKLWKQIKQYALNNNLTISKAAQKLLRIGLEEEGKS